MITASDIYVEEDQEEREDFSDLGRKEHGGSKPSTPNRKERCEHTAEKSRSGREANPDSERRDRARSRSAPAKRVMSDTHWRTKKSPPRNKASPKNVEGAIRAKDLGDDGIRVKPIPDLQSRRKQKNHDDGTPRKKETLAADDGIRVFPTPPSSRKPSRNMEALQKDDILGSAAGQNDHEAPSSRSPRSHGPDSRKRSKYLPSEESIDIGTSAAKVESSRRRSIRQKGIVTDAERLSSPREFPETRESTKSPKGNILSQVFEDTRKIFSKQQPLPVSAPRVPSVEAWLKETSDPFVDGTEPSLDEIVPIRLSPQVVNEAEQVRPVKDPNKIWDSLEQNVPTGNHHGKKRRKRTDASIIYEDLPAPTALDVEIALSASPTGSTAASKMCDLLQDPPKPSPTLLKRRGARKTVSSPSKFRHKTQPYEEPISEMNSQSVLSSIETTSSLEASDPLRPLRPPGLTFKRPFPSTGQHRLSTIASVETFDTQIQNAAPSSLSRISATFTRPHTHGDANERPRDTLESTSLKRSKSRLTRHADLMSVLSHPRAGSKSIKSARSIRTNRSRLATATIEDLLKELAMDEIKYMRELRTLVDGVIPVLLTCVLSKSDSAVAAGLFRPCATPNKDPNFTKPIIDMGVGLERLKSLHKRIPTQDVNGFLSWAQGAQRVYADYLKAWRMGFQDVVVNLAPAAEGDVQDPALISSDQDGLDGGLPRNEDGDVVDGDGGRVDVAYLLKRPLVRLKHLAKTLKGINFLIPSSEAESLINKYQSLVSDARNRSDEERARLEDEAAMSIEVTKARDIRTLAPLTGVNIDKTRHVRARDHFDLILQHSSGQRVDCRVELLLRDEANGRSNGGDLLICEVESTGRWLLFPPVECCSVSARNGDLRAEIIIMLRGLSSNGSQWQELLSLRTDDEQVGFEWVQMLGLIPVPPKISRSHSFLSTHSRKESRIETDVPDSEHPLNTKILGKSRTPSPREIEVPIGENMQTCVDSPVQETMKGSEIHFSRDQDALQKKAAQPDPMKLSKSSHNLVERMNDLRSLPSQTTGLRMQIPKQNQNVRDMNIDTESHVSSSPSSLRRTKAKRMSRYGDGSPTGAKTTEFHAKEPSVARPRPDDDEANRSPKSSSFGHNDMRCGSPESCISSSDKVISEQHSGSARPAYHRSLASVPSMNLPTIPKVRKESSPTSILAEPEEELDWVVPHVPESPRKLTKKRPTSLEKPTEHRSLPSTPPHKSPILNGVKTPVLNANPSQNAKRRSSSPLKHEYEPSESSRSSSESSTSTVERNELTSVSDSSDDEEFEAALSPSPLLPLGTFQSISNRTPRASLYSLPNSTLSPSQSASQAPYKTVPSQPTKASKTIASIFSWSDRGAWERLHPEECSIVITPGLIEAFKMSAAHSKIIPPRSSSPVTDVDGFSELSSKLEMPSKESEGERPLIALELTPLVPLRRGTALDISIRSPPTANSQITSGSNIMFRSRNAEECEALYALINHSRIHNPTYMALQNARGPYGSGSYFAPILDRRNSGRVASQASSWFGSLGRSSSYRANSAPTPSIALSESSVGSRTSVFSALRRFGKGGRFNIARSTISSRYGSGANSVYTASDNSGGSGTSTPKSAAIGLKDAKIRLYVRDPSLKWCDLGAARLTILPATSPLQSPLVEGPEKPRRPMGRVLEKRIVINGKKGELLLDELLGEQCFERVARTGIAVNVWNDTLGPNGEVGVVGAVGGVGGGRSTVYMIQVSFSMGWVGKMRSMSLTF